MLNIELYIVIFFCFFITHSMSFKGLGSLSIDFCPANMEKSFFTKSLKILQWLQNITYLL